MWVAAAVTIGLLYAPAALAQTVVDTRLWTTIGAQGRMGSTSPWQWSADTLVRLRDGVRTLDVAGERVMLSRGLTKRSSVGAGYGFTTTFPDEDDAVREHRFIEQYAWSTRWRRSTLSFRTRLEQRLIEGNDRTMIRIREQVRITRPVATKLALTLVVWDEYFAYANTTSRARRGFDSNRAFAGLRHAIASNATLEIGYLNLFIRGQRGSRDRLSHIGSATVGLAF
jgi:hypothetical protein